MCLAQGHNAVRLVRLEPAALWSFTQVLLSFQHACTQFDTDPGDKRLLPKWALTFLVYIDFKFFRFEVS